MFFNSKLPWESRKPIFEFILDNINRDGKLGNETLPDEPVGKNEIKWVAGALDGVAGHHSSCKDMDKELARLTKSISVHGKKKDKIKFYNMVLEDNILSIIDSTMDEIVKLDTRITDNLYEWCKFLAFESPDRGAVKIGIALLGLIGAKDVLNRIKILGLHEEFTLYVAVAISKLSENVEEDIWELAKKVNGWGRISLVERLANTINPKIKYWILTQGYKNNIMYEYLALIAAETGELKKELLADNVEKIILTSACDLIQSMMSEGPCSGISVYHDAAETIELFIKHTIGKRDDLAYLLTYGAVYDYITDESIECSGLKENGWNNEKCDKIISILKDELINDEWKDLVKQKSTSNDDKEFWITKSAAGLLKLDFFDVFWKRLKNDPLDSGKWFDIMNVANKQNIQEILEFGLLNIPLSQIATGPDTLLGLGLEYNFNTILDFILQALNKFEGEGITYIIAGLKSPVTRNRNMAISALEEWGVSHISSKLSNIINEAEKIEPNKDVKERLIELMLKVQYNEKRENDSE